MTILAGLGMVLLGVSVSQLASAGERTAPQSGAVILLEHIEFTSFAKHAGAEERRAYENARDALAQASRSGATLLREPPASYLGLLEGTSHVFLKAEHESTRAVLSALISVAADGPTKEAEIAYQTARLAYIEHLLSRH